jgi:rod shape-determining protein MreC
LDPAGNIVVGDTLFSNGSDGNTPFIPGVPVGVVSSVDHSSATLTQTASVKSYSDLNNVGVVSVVISAPTTAPKTMINPTPRATVIVYVTPTPSPTPTRSLSPSPTPSASKKATK